MQVKGTFEDEAGTKVVVTVDFNMEENKMEVSIKSANEGQSLSELDGTHAMSMAVHFVESLQDKAEE